MAVHLSPPVSYSQLHPQKKKGKSSLQRTTFQQTLFVTSRTTFPRNQLQILHFTMSVQLFDNLSRILCNLSTLQSFCLSVGLLICQAVSQLLYWMVCLFICLSAFLMHVCPSTGICFDFVMVYSCLLCFIDSTIQLWLISNNTVETHS